MQPNAFPPLWVVEQAGGHDFTTTSLTIALRHIGRAISGTSFGCMRVTARQAVAAGYSIRQA